MARLEYAMMTVTPVVILFLAQGQEQLYRGSDFGQGQLRAKLVPRLPVLLSPCNLRKEPDSRRGRFFAMLRRFGLRSIPSSAEFIGWECEAARGKD